MEMLDIIDQLNERTRWARGIVSLISTDPDISDETKEASDCAVRQLEKVRSLLRDLWETRNQPQD